MRAEQSLNATRWLLRPTRCRAAPGFALGIGHACAALVGLMGSISAAHAQPQCAIEELFRAPAAFDGDSPDTQHLTAQLSIEDFDSDGRLDILTVGIFNGGFTTPNVSLLCGNGDGTFEQAVQLTDFDNSLLGISSSLITPDLNGDGNPDIVVGDGGFPTAAAALSNGDGTFQTPFQVAPGGEVFGIAAGDFDADGAIDLAFTNKFDDQVTVRFGDGDGGFGLSRSVASSDSPFWIVAEDFDGDGHDDLAVTHVDADGFDDADEVAILLSNGDRTFEPARIVLVGDQPSEIIAADLDDDGHVDLATANSGNGNPGLSVLLGNGDGTFQPELSLEGATAGLTAADLDGDGTLDLVGINAGTNLAAVHLGNGDGTFQDPAHYLIGDRNPQMVAAADLDGDGDLDLASTQFFAGNVSVMLNDGAARFELPALPLTPDSAAQAIGDFDADGNADLAIADRVRGTVQMWFGRTGGGFEPGLTFASDPVLDMLSPLVLASGLATLDANGDGIDDLVSINAGVTAGIGTVAIHLSNGDRTFQPVTKGRSITLSAGLPGAVRTLDSNADGVVDLAITGGDTITLLVGDGEAGFTQQIIDDASGLGLTRIASGDLDTDGDSDLVAASGSEAVVFRNEGDGSFPLIQTLDPDCFAITAIEIIDIDGDQSPDIVVSCNSGIDEVDGTIEIFANLDDGRARFRSSPLSSSIGILSDPRGSQPVSLAVADFNADGLQDLVLGSVALNIECAPPDVPFSECDTDLPRGYLGVLLNDGDGQLVGPSGLPYPLPLRLGKRAATLLAEDLNADGAPDLSVVAVGDYGSHSNASHVTLANLCATLPSCPADLTGPGGDGVPDGSLTSDDFFFYLGLFADGDLEADLTGPGGDGEPDGSLTSDDFFFYLGLFAAGCP